MCSRFLATLPSGTRWKNRSGPMPDWSSSVAHSPVPSSPGSGPPSWRSPSAAAQKRASATGSAASMVRLKRTPIGHPSVRCEVIAADRRARYLPRSVRSVRAGAAAGLRPARYALPLPRPTVTPPAHRGGSDAPHRPRRAAAGHLDRRQGVDDPEARAGRPRGLEAGRPGDALPGAVLRALLLPGPGPAVLQLHGADPRRADHQADAGPREADRDG